MRNIVGCLLLLVPLAGPAAAAGPVRSDIEARLRAALADRDRACPELPGLGPGLAAFYPPGAPKPLWVDEGRPTARAGRLRAALARADEEGLSPADYGLADIEARWGRSEPGVLACLDLALTAAFDRLVRDLAAGRLLPREADPAWHLLRPRADPVAVLRAASPAADLGEELARLAPSHGLYRRLRAALARYRQLAAAGGWETSLAGPVLAEGDEDERVPALRERLRRQGDLEEAAGSGPRFDGGLAEAVRRFQRRHGLADDGVVGPRTQAALNTPLAVRIAQLRRAMERVRWMPRDLGPRYVLVNTAAFELALVEGEQSALRMRVIVGMPSQPTPSFAATIRSVVINPYWNVPARIVRDRLLPRERREPGYLARHGFRVLDAGTGRWRTADGAALAEAAAAAAPVRLRQDPGPGNLMGRLSFVLPNPHDVFLHDTPDRALFAREVRACSEGCVRLERPMALALALLRRLPEWTADRIQQEIDALRHHVLALPEPVPAYVVYLPAWVDDGGVVHFRPDHYGRDDVLAAHFPS